MGGARFKRGWRDYVGGAAYWTAAIVVSVLLGQKLWEKWERDWKVLGLRIRPGLVEAYRFREMPGGGGYRWVDERGKEVDYQELDVVEWLQPGDKPESVLAAYRAAGLTVEEYRVDKKTVLVGKGGMFDADED